MKNNLRVLVLFAVVLVTGCGAFDDVANEKVNVLHSRISDYLKDQINEISTTEERKNTAENTRLLIPELLDDISISKPNDPRREYFRAVEKALNKEYSLYEVLERNDLLLEGCKAKEDTLSEKLRRVNCLGALFSDISSVVAVVTFTEHLEEISKLYVEAAGKSGLSVESKEVYDENLRYWSAKSGEASNDFENIMKVVRGEVEMESDIDNPLDLFVGFYKKYPYPR